MNLDKETVDAILAMLDKRIACLEADRTDAMHKRDYQKQIECIQKKKQEATLIREAIALGSAVVRGEN